LRRGEGEGEASRGRGGHDTAKIVERRGDQRGRERAQATATRGDQKVESCCRFSSLFPKH
jgi:hypothetical protein